MSNSDSGNVKSSTIKVYLTGLRSYCVDQGYSTADLEVFTHPQVQRTVKGVPRLYPAREVPQSEVTSPETAAAMLPAPVVPHTASVENRSLPEGRYPHDCPLAN